MERKHIYLALKVFKMKLVGSASLFVLITILLMLTSMNNSNLFSNSYILERGIEIKLIWFFIEYQYCCETHVHECIFLKRDPGLARHAKVVFEGREATKKLQKLGKLALEDDFETYQLLSDDFADDVNYQPHI